MRAEADLPFPEEQLHLLWKQGSIADEALFTTAGERIRILNPGIPNATNGPDFRKSRIRIGDMIFHGDVEIHLRASHWYHHGHHRDPEYDNVILHVVGERSPGPVLSFSGASPATLSLYPHLSARQRAARSRHSIKQLPCAATISFISQEAFAEQIEKAHREYFEEKCRHFFTSYDPHLPGTLAWKKALIIHLFDGLGISHNRKAMRMLAERLFDGPFPEELLISDALKHAGLGREPETGLKWNLRSVQRADHPRLRIPQAVRISNEILAQDPGDILRDTELVLWETWVREAGSRYTNRLKILFGTCYLPAIFNAGQLYGSHPLSESAYQKWKSLRSPVPEALLRPFLSTGMPARIYRGRLGSVHQLRSYCDKKRCSDCLLIKKAILS